MLVSILRQRSYLIASIHEALDDGESGIIIDVAALDVIDSFGARALQNLARMARLRGAETVIVGIQPMVAFTMVRLGMLLSDLHTALDLEEGLHGLDRLVGPESRLATAHPDQDG
jgi:rsbT antagonist protein RsbS